jgi:hypothetical protein
MSDVLSPEWWENFRALGNRMVIEAYTLDIVCEAGASDEAEYFGSREQMMTDEPVPWSLERERAQWQGVIDDWVDAYARQGRELDALKRAGE